MSELILAFVIALLFYIVVKEKRASKESEDKRLAMLRRAHDVCVWCGSEFSNMKDAAAYIAREDMYQKETYYNHSRHGQNIDTLRNKVRGDREAKTMLWHAACDDDYRG